MMSGGAKDRWRRLDELFHAASALAAANRARFLAVECGEDIELMSEVEALLAADRDDDFLIGPDSPSLPEVGSRFHLAGDVAGNVAGDVAGESGTRSPVENSFGTGRSIGSYKILRLLASGGMGSVYEAEQSHPERRVALKIMRGGLFSASSVRRFEYESEVLGRLRHPGVAQVFEAGNPGRERADVALVRDGAHRGCDAHHRVRAHASAFDVGSCRATGWGLRRGGPRSSKRCHSP